MHLGSVQAEKFKGIKRHSFRIHVDFMTELTGVPDYSSYAFDSGGKHYQIHIQGIHCSGCISKIERLPILMPNHIQAAMFNLGSALLRVELTQVSSLRFVLQQLESMGFKAEPITPEESLEEIYKKGRRKDLVRLGVAGACASNIMILAVSIYAGLDGYLATIFNYAQGVIFLPILLFVAVPFFKNALQGLKNKQINLDFPLSIALVLSSLFSYASLFRDQESIYFDSSAGFIFLILATRLWVQRVKEKSEMESFLPNKSLSTTTLRLSPGGDYKDIPTNRIKVGDTILVHDTGHALPVDGTLLSENAQFETALISGEHYPRVFQKNDIVLAGMKCLTPHTSLRVEKTGTSTQLAALLRRAQTQQMEKSHQIAQADRAAQWLIAVVLGVATLLFIFFLPTQPQEGFRRALALIVVACPCALGLGVPLALLRGLRECSFAGIFIRSAQVFEKLPQIRTFVFDKTGTLTLGKLKLVHAPLISDDFKSIILSLGKLSNHPISLCLRQAWPGVPFVELEKVTETAGIGLQGIFKNQMYELKRSGGVDSNIGPTASLFQNGKAIFTLEFQDQIKPEAIPLLAHLRKLGFQTYLLTGDNQRSALDAGRKIGFQDHEILYEKSPEDKAKFVEQKHPCVLIGDGINDTLGMSKAHVSIATQGSVQAALKSADIFLAKSEINDILPLLEIARSVNRILSRNLIFAITYNLLAGAAAIAGWIGPLGAAILMPASSLLIILSSLQPLNLPKDFRKKP